jgi:hypothetical protein
MIVGPLLDSMKGKLLVGSSDAVFTEHAWSDTSEASPSCILALAVGANTIWRRCFAFEDGMKEFSTPAEPFSCEIVLRLFHEFISKSSYVLLIGFDITFLVFGMFGMSKEGRGGESIISEGSILRILEGVDREGELVGGASFLFILIPLDVFCSK